MKKSIVISILFIFLLPKVNAKVSAVFNYGKFQTKDKNSYIEAYLSVKGSSLVKSRSENGSFKSEVIVSYIITNDSNEVVTFKKFKLATPDLTDSTQSLDIIDVKRLVIPNGYYSFELVINDANTTIIDFETKFNFTMEFNTKPVEFSTIELVESYSKTKTENEFSKAGFDIIPNVSSFYDIDKNMLTFYTELYGTNSLGDSSQFLIDYSINEENTNKVAFNLRGISKLTSSRKHVILKNIDISKLPSGNFQFSIRAISKNNDTLAEMSIPFKRSNPFVVYEFNDLDQSFVANITDRDTLYMYINYLYPISSDVQKDFVKNQLGNKDLRLMQEFFLGFWKEKNSSDPQSAWLSYKDQIRIANDIFGFQTRPGYLTDRGRIYLQYGEPTNRMESQYEASAYPYEIWQYDQLRNLGNRRFVFYSKELGMTDYMLLHSNVPSEVYFPQWQTVIYERTNPRGNNIDNDGVRDHFGNRAGDFYNNPR
tara:strand:+ start:539 stop:1984 length:1446 start_codon:yes stop_codon:yes gene_type:complete